MAGSLLSSLVILVAVAVGVFFYATRLEETSVPEEHRKDHYWGNKPWKLGTPVPKDDETVRPFKIAVEEPVLQDLKTRLAKTRFQPSIPGVNFEYGFPSEELKKIIDYWSNKYAWRKEEQRLNRYNHFKTQIEGLDIHFLHVKPKQTAGNTPAVPLLLVHGWPGSFIEFYKIIPLLTESKDINFELIIPSIPGYGFSEASQKPGLGLPDAARIFVKLMKRLGHETFLYHGGDWGSIIGQFISVMYPENVIGYHTNCAFLKMSPTGWLRLLLADLGLQNWVFDEPEVEIQRMNPLSKVVTYILKESGYFHIHATKPDTVGKGLNDSPAGLAAYILEKFSTWTNPANVEKPDGGLSEKFTLDELLTNVMIYWINGNIVSSQRLYKEAIQLLNEKRVFKVPFGAVIGRHELPMSVPKTILKSLIPNLVQYKDADVGGHFLAMEEPKLVADDIKEFCLNIKGMK